MHKHSKYTLDFLNDELKKLSRLCFNIDKESRVILGIIAKNGPSSETKITSLGKRRIILSREIIRYRILNSDLSGKDNFLTMKKGKKIGNLKKIEKLFSLTFKGLLASLSEIPLNENFWVKNYLEMIKELTSEITASEFIKHLYFHVTVFMIYHSKKDGMLTHYKEPETDFYDEYYPEGPLGNLLSQTNIKGIPIESKDLFIHCIENFFVSSEIVGNLVKKSLNIDYKSKTEDEMFWEYDEYVDNFFRRWMWTMFLAIDYSPKKIMKLYEEDDEENAIEDSINVEDVFGPEMWDEFSFTARDELQKLDSELVYDMSESLFAN